MNLSNLAELSYETVKIIKAKTCSAIFARQNMQEKILPLLTDFCIKLISLSEISLKHVDLPTRESCKTFMIEFMKSPSKVEGLILKGVEELQPKQVTFHVKSGGQEYIALDPIRYAIYSERQGFSGHIARFIIKEENQSEAMHMELKLSMLLSELFTFLFYPSESVLLVAENIQRISDEIRKIILAQKDVTSEIISDYLLKKLINETIDIFKNLPIIGSLVFVSGMMGFDIDGALKHEDVDLLSRLAKPLSYLPKGQTAANASSVKTATTKETQAMEVPLAKYLRTKERADLHEYLSSVKKFIEDVKKIAETEVEKDKKEVQKLLASGFKDGLTCAYQNTVGEGGLLGAVKSGFSWFKGALFSSDGDTVVIPLDDDASAPPRLESSPSSVPDTRLKALIKESERSRRLVEPRAHAASDPVIDAHHAAALRLGPSADELSATSSETPRGSLLSSIRAGTQLKKTSKSPVVAVPSDPIATALAKHRKHVAPEPEPKPKSEEKKEDEWNKYLKYKAKYLALKKLYN